MTALPILNVKPGSESNSALARELASAVEGEVRFGLHDRMLYATDASLYQVEPLGVVIPASVEDALAAADFCARRGLPILPRGGGTSLAGQCTNRAVVIDFSPRCHALRSVDVEGRSCEVEPGITVDDLNDRLAAHKLFFAPDPATSRQANVGGCIGNNAAGGRSIKYGRTSESVLAVDAAVVSGGARRVRFEAGSGDPLVRELNRRVAEVVRRHERLIRERFPKTIRRNAGYSLDLILKQMDEAGPDADSDAILSRVNLASLLCGSEGTLAVTLGATLRLHPVPQRKGLAAIGLNSLDEAIAAVAPILATKPSAVELLDDTVIDLASANAEYRRYVELMPAPREGGLRAVLYVEYFQSQTASQRDSEGGIEDRFAALREVVARAAPTARMSEYTDAKSMAAAWKLRKAGEPLLHGMPGDRKPITFVEDNAVPVERLGEFVREFRKIVQRRGTGAAFWAHASVGVLHVRPFLDIRSEQDRVLVQEIAVEVAELARSLGGVMSGEHGDGRVRGPLLERFYGPELMGAFREVKAIFDPGNLLNPGNIVEPGPVASIVETLRVKPDAAFVDVPGVETYFDYEDQHGFRGAVEMCNGAGVCRKKGGGTMCPSYMATLDERHATRGRGNALRLAITGQLEPDNRGARWNDAETLETLDLCLSCKGCKTECPSNVDIARLKAEYLAQGYRASGRIPLKARVFGHVRALNRLGAITPGIANWVNRLPLTKWVLGKALGFATQRSVPEFARPLTAKKMNSAMGRSAPTVAVFGDCFTTYNEPGIGLAAKRVLEAFGYRVRFVNAGCCGRAMISTGLLGDAAAAADATLERLRVVIEDDSVAAMVVCEPSCLSAIKDDWLELKMRTPIAVRQKLAAKSWLVEEFLEKAWDSHPRRPEVKSGGPLLLHGHCHQKALWGAESSAGLLRRLLGEKVKVLDTGCCGMAGSFGYTEGHYELSMKIGELSLFPAVRASGGAAVCAPGTSCRHQIKDGTGARALHPVEVVSGLIG